METSIRNLSAQRAISGLLKTFTVLHHKVVRIPSPVALPYEMFKYGIPYEASETYRTIRNEFESNKSVAILEARSALSRC